MKKKEKDILKIIFEAGLKCNELHPDDDSYDNIHFEKALATSQQLADIKVTPKK